MARQRLPKRLDQKSAIKLMERNGWINSKGGKHVVKMTKPGHRPVTLPMHRGEDYGVSLTRSIFKSAGLE